MSRVSRWFLSPGTLCLLLTGSLGCTIRLPQGSVLPPPASHRPGATSNRRAQRFNAVQVVDNRLRLGRWQGMNAVSPGITTITPRHVFKPRTHQPFSIICSILTETSVFIPFREKNPLRR